MEIKKTWFNYQHQFWVIDGIIQPCGHEKQFLCSCSGRTWAYYPVDAVIGYLNATSKVVL